MAFPYASVQNDLCLILRGIEGICGADSELMRRPTFREMIAIPIKHPGNRCRIHAWFSRMPSKDGSQIGGELTIDLGSRHGNSSDLRVPVVVRFDPVPYLRARIWRAASDTTECPRAPSPEIVFCELDCPVDALRSGIVSEVEQQIPHKWERNPLVLLGVLVEDEQFRMLVEYPKTMRHINRPQEGTE